MANEVKKAVSKAGRTVGRQDNLTKALIKAGSNIEKRKTAIKDVSSYKDYLNLDPGTVSKLKTSELRTVVARLNKVESKRLKNLEKYGYTALGDTVQSVRALDETGGRTKASRDMTRQELMHEYKRAKSFLLAETSTVAGARKFIGGISEMVGADRELSSDEIKRLYGLLNKFKESGAVEFYKKGGKKSAGYQESVKAQQDIFDYMQEDLSDDEILTKLGVMDRVTNESMQDTSDNFKMFGGHRP